MTGRRIAITVLAFVVGLVAVDRAAGFALRRVFDQTLSGDSGGMVNHALANADADIIVFGTSRAAHHVDSAVLADRLGADVYNAGVNGQRIFYSRMLQALLLEQGTDASVFVLQAETRGLFKPEPQRALVMTPFAGRSRVVRQTLRRIDPNVGVKLLSAVYPFNSKLPSMLRNFRRPPPVDQFEPLRGQMDGAPVPTERFEEDLTVAPPYEPDAFAADMYRDFVSAARDAGVEVFMFSGPRYRTGGEGPAYSRAFAFFEELAEQDGVTFVPLNEVTHPEFLDGALYRDRDHLNARGAALLTERLADAMAATYGATQR